MFYVLQVKTGTEMSVKNALEEMSIASVVPIENRLQKKGGAWNTKEYVLFPGYIFVDLNYSAEMYYKLKDLPGAIQLLGGGFHPSFLSPIEVEWIKLLNNGGLPIEPTKVSLNDEGKIETYDGILNTFSSKIKSVDRHAKKATFEISICGEIKEVTLSIETV